MGEAVIGESPQAIDVALPGPSITRAVRVQSRRLSFLALVVATVALVSFLLLDMIRVNGTTPLEYVIFMLTLVLVVPITISFWMSILGFIVEMRGGDPLALDLSESETADGFLHGPNAIVVPIYNEDPERVIAGIIATRASLEQTGHLDEFDVFVLSDTMDPRRWLEEELAITRFRARLPDPSRVRYRNRTRNVDKKAGNIADFCRHHGTNYRYMIVFDADSVMSGSTLVRLVRLMERHPNVGIIQAPPVPVNRRTLFGRLQQFAARAYGSTSATGLAYLQCGSGNYYGHNAILRIAPFIEHCRLPMLPGKAPLGGSVLSHDFVEAALMRRGGFHVFFATDLGGSFEEPPPTLVDYSVRDRRWCQGNLQHARLLGMPGLHPVSRMHLLLGVMSYLGSPVWMLLLMISTAEAVRGHFDEHQYFAPGGSLFPIWEISIENQAVILFAIVMAFLFVPRALALVTRLRDANERKHFGGGARLLMSGAAECLFSMLLAPGLALTQTQFVISILMGRSTGWDSQTRDDRGTTFMEALRRHAGALVLGIAWAWLLLRFSPELLGWMSPVLVGMVLSMPLSMWSSRVSAGDWARRQRLFSTPEEIAPEPVLVRLREELARLEPDEATYDPRGALERVLTDAEASTAHLSLLEEPEITDPLEEHVVQGLTLKCRLHGPSALNDEEQRHLLLAPHALRGLLAESSATDESRRDRAVGAASEP